MSKTQQTTVGRCLLLYQSNRSVDYLVTRSQSGSQIYNTHKIFTRRKLRIKHAEKEQGKQKKDYSNEGCKWKIV